MSDSSDKVLVAKNALMSALGDNVQAYLDNMKLWFRQKWSKEEFDINSRRLLTSDKMELHNQFLLAILNKIDVLQTPQPSTPIHSTSYNSSSRNSRKRKRSSKASSDRATFEPYDIMEYLVEDSLDYIRPPNAIDDNGASVPSQKYCVQEVFLPDQAFIMGRLLVGAWESGLMNVEDVVAEYVASAVQVLLKNIVTEVILKRKHYKITGEKTFFYDVGAPIKDPFVRNTVTRQRIDDGPLELSKEITLNLTKRNNDETIFLSACEEPLPQMKKNINLWDLYNALQNKNVIPSHTVYSINMERLTQLLN